LMKPEIDECLQEFVNTRDNTKNYSIKYRTSKLRFKHFFTSDNILVIKQRLH
jgi:hypothetical protein